MKPEEKELLLKDLCARLPYGVKFATKYSHFKDTHELLVINKHSTIVETFKMLWWDIEDVKPYLRPMSSMTEEEEKEYNLLANRCMCTTVGFIHLEAEPLLDWLNKKMFDFRGLIPKDLALSTEIYDPYKD